MSESKIDAVCVPLSATCTVKLAVPDEVGVPLITLLVKLRPAGNVPVIDHT